MNETPDSTEPGADGAKSFSLVPPGFAVFAMTPLEIGELPGRRPRGLPDADSVALAETIIKIIAGEDAGEDG